MGPPGADDTDDDVIRDAVGNVLADDDTVKSLDVKGTPGIQASTKVRNICLVNGAGVHDIDCKVDGIGPMPLSPAWSRKSDPPSDGSLFPYMSG